MALPWPQLAWVAVAKAKASCARTVCQTPSCHCHGCAGLGLPLPSAVAGPPSLRGPILKARAMWRGGTSLSLSLVAGRGSGGVTGKALLNSPPTN